MTLLGGAGFAICLAILCWLGKCVVEQYPIRAEYSVLFLSVLTLCIIIAAEKQQLVIVFPLGFFWMGYVFGLTLLPSKSG